MSTDNKQKILQTVSKVMNVPVEKISPAASSAEIATWDSLNHLNLMVALEGEFGIHLSPEDMIAMRSVPEIQEKLRKHGVQI